MFENLNEKNYLQLILFGLVLLLSSVLLMSLGYVIGIFIWDGADVTLALEGTFENDNQINILKMFQVLNQLSMFIIPPFVLYFLLRKKIENYLGLSISPNINTFIALVFLYIFSIPFIQWSMEINQHMSLPEALSGVESWMKEKEDIGALITEKFLNVSTLSGFLLNIIMMAVLPAIGEELLFRGLLMRWFSKAISNIHINIIITAFLFSAIHMQFFGFLPRFILGIILGYSYYWTKSIWAPIWLHFINNATTVTVYYWAFNSNSNVNPEEVGNVAGLEYVLLSVIIVAAILRWMYKNRIEN